MTRALEDAVAELALGPPLDPADPGAVEAWLRRHGVEKADAEALRRGGLKRLMVYRRLVRANLRGAVTIAIPRVVARLDSIFDEYFDRFLAERGPRTHYLRDVTTEMLDFCADDWETDERVPAYMMSLARHESVVIELNAMPVCSTPSAAPELSLEQPVLFIEAVRLMRHRFAVHELTESEDDRTVPTRREVALLGYRSPDHDVRFLELTPLAAEIMQRLLAGAALGDALTSAAQACDEALTQPVIDGSARLLSDLAERGALLGTERAHAPGTDSSNSAPTTLENR